MVTFASGRKSRLVKSEFTSMSLDPTQFLSKLQGELSEGSLEIAGFPDTCIRLLRELRDVFVSNNTLARIVKSDPALSLRVISMANSAAFQASSGPIGEVTGAISRIGLATLRTVVLAHAFATLRDQKTYKLVQGRMGDIWSRSLAIAVAARAVASRCENRRVDREALVLGGMLNGVGKIYLLAEMAHHEKVLEDFAAVEHLLETWHEKITRRLLTLWEFSDATVRAATGWELARSPTAEDVMADILYVSSLLVDLRDNREELARRLPMSAPAMRLGLATVDPAELYSAADSEATSIKGAMA